jgi:hypothetical protein
VSEGTGIDGLDTLVIWVAALTVLGTAVAAVWRWSRGVRRIGRRFEEFADDWQGTEERPGVPSRPGVMERLACFDTRLHSLDSRLAGVEHQMRPNSGSSMRDAIDRVERCVTPDGDDQAGALRTM